MSEPGMGPNPPRVRRDWEGCPEATLAARASPPDWRYGGIYETGMGTYPPRVALALHAPANQRSARGIGISTPCGAVSTRENSIFAPGVPEIRAMDGRLNRGWGTIIPGLPSLYAPQPISDRPWDWGSHILRGGVDPGELDIRPRGVGVVEIWKNT